MVCVRPRDFCCSSSASLCSDGSYTAPFQTRDPLSLDTYSTSTLARCYRPPWTRSSSLCSRPLPSPCRAHSPLAGSRIAEMLSLLTRPGGAVVVAGPGPTLVEGETVPDGDAAPAGSPARAEVDRAGKAPGAAMVTVVARLGEIVPGRCSGDRWPEVISPRGVTCVGTDNSKSVGDKNEMRRADCCLFGVRCAGKADTGATAPPAADAGDDSPPAAAGSAAGVLEAAAP